MASAIYAHRLECAVTSEEGARLGQVDGAHRVMTRAAGHHVRGQLHVDGLSLCQLLHGALIALVHLLASPPVASAVVLWEATVWLVGARPELRRGLRGHHAAAVRHGTLALLRRMHVHDTSGLSDRRRRRPVYRRLGSLASIILKHVLVVDHLRHALQRRAVLR